jgi:hypothetical protein
MTQASIRQNEGKPFWRIKGCTHSANGIHKGCSEQTPLRLIKYFYFSIILWPLCVENIQQSLDFTELNVLEQQWALNIGRVQYLGHVLLCPSCFVRITLPINVVLWLSAHTILVYFIRQNAFGVFWTGERNTPYGNNNQTYESFKGNRQTREQVTKGNYVHTCNVKWRLALLRNLYMSVTVTANQTAGRRNNKVS